jgi:hypothetical protein
VKQDGCRFEAFQAEDGGRSYGNAENTLQSNKKAGNTLRECLKESGQDSKFEEVRLNEVIRQFYINARKPDGNHYKISWLENLRYGLDRYLRSSIRIILIQYCTEIY